MLRNSRTQTIKIIRVKTHSIINNTYNKSDYDSDGRLKPHILDKELDNDFNRLVS